MEGVPLVFLALFAIIAITVVIVGYLSAQRRREELGGWCLRNGLDFRSAPDKRFETAHPFRPLQRGHRRTASNVMSGDWRGRPFLGFDYRYVTGSGKNRRTHHLSGVIIGSEIPLKPLLIRPEGLLDRVGAAIGFDDIDFESAEFSRRFYVASPDRKWAYDVIHQRTMELLLATPEYEIHFAGHSVLVCRDRNFTLAQFESAALLAHGILDLLPDYLRRQQADMTRGR